MKYAGWDRVGAFGCGKQLIEISWDYKPPFPSPYATLCTYRPAVGSWANCIREIANENATNAMRTFEDSVKFVNIVCEKAGGGLAQFTVEEWHSHFNNATEYLKPLPINEHISLSYPVFLDELKRRTLIRGVRAEFLNLDESNEAAMWIYYYFAAILLIYTLYPLMERMFRKVVLISPRIVNKLSALYKAKLVVGMAWGSSSHSQSSIWALGGWVPNAEESVILAGFMIVHTFALTCNYSIDHKEILEPMIEQRWQAIGNRSGILAIAMLPLLLLLTTRSSILIFITGMKYSSHLLLHRWIGRVIIIDSIIHSIAFYVHERMGGMLSLVSIQRWWIAGLVATALCCIIGFMGAGAFRRRYYEIFLYTHIVFAIVFIYECWVHVQNFGWLNWLRISVGLWALERIYRMLLIWKNGIVTATLDAKNCTHSTLNTEGNDKLLTLIMKRPKNWHMSASQYAFVYFMIPTIFWQSHPFTVSLEDPDNLKLVIAVKSGATKSLHSTLLSRARRTEDERSQIQVKMLFEGPYGVAPNITHFKSMILICGGSGVPGPLGLALTASRLIQPSNMRLVIVVRDWAILDAYRIQLMEIKAVGIGIKLYYTGKVENPEWSLYTEISYGRPNIKGLLNDFVTTNNANDGKLGVVCCGPASLNDSTRGSVAESIIKFPDVDIEFSEEYQVW